MHYRSTALTNGGPIRKLSDEERRSIAAKNAIETQDHQAEETAALEAAKAQREAERRRAAERSIDESQYSHEFF